MVGVAEGAEEVGPVVVGGIVVGSGVTTLATGAPVGMRFVAAPVGDAVGSTAISGASVGASASSVGAGVSGRISVGQDMVSPSEMQTMPGQAGQLERHWLVSTTHRQVDVETQPSQVVAAVHSWPTVAREPARKRSAEMSFILLLLALFVSQGSANVCGVEGNSFAFEKAKSKEQNIKQFFVVWRAFRSSTVRTDSAGRLGKNQKAMSQDAVTLYYYILTYMYSYTHKTSY